MAYSVDRGARSLCVVSRLKNYCTD